MSPAKPRPTALGASEGRGEMVEQQGSISESSCCSFLEAGSGKQSHDTGPSLPCGRLRDNAKTHGVQSDGQIKTYGISGDVGGHLG